MNAVTRDVEKLAEKELTFANNMFPPFRSGHEGYAVILEELQETEKELKRCKEWLEYIWEDIKNNETGLKHANNLKSYALCGAMEFIQVAAMAQKYIDSLGGAKHGTYA